MREPEVSLRILDGCGEGLRELQRVLEEAPAYAEWLTGAPPGAAEARSLFNALPPGKSYEDKFVFGIHVDDAMVGCVDLVRGYPNEATAMLGLLLVSEKHQRKGIGRRSYPLVEECVRSWPRCERVRIGVVLANEPVLAFWRGIGFEPTGEVKPYRHGGVVSQIVVLERQVRDVPCVHE
jgi:RimJ/RimL family protein N-acetyltransferase